MRRKQYKIRQTNFFKSRSLTVVSPIVGGVVDDGGGGGGVGRSVSSVSVVIDRVEKSFNGPEQ